MSRYHDLPKRILPAIFIGNIFIIGFFVYESLFVLLMILVLLGMLYEWCNMIKSCVVDIFIGFMLILLAILSLIIVRYQIDGSRLLFLYFCNVWSTDIFAYVGGKYFQGPKLAPKISPNKTWSGLCSGVISAFLICQLLNYVHYLQYFTFLEASIFSLIIPLISQMSDLFVSFFKRKYNIKDTGNIIPGHGGILDRFDSIIFSAPLLLLCIEF